MSRVDPRRSVLMARVRGKDTKPEIIVRKTAFALGYRYRLHRRDLSGSPDLVFVGRRKAIFVHGCFWHRHKGCSKTTTPKIRKKFWQSKFDANIRRDAKNVRELRSAGWKVLVIWECETANLVALQTRLNSFLGQSG